MAVVIRPFASITVGLAAVFAVAGTASAQSTLVTVPAAADCTLYAENSAVGNGKGPTMFAGSTASGAIRRSLVRFDLSALPAHAKIESATVRLRLSKTTSGATLQSLFALTAPWGEGPSNAGDPGGSGTAAQPGDATWGFALYNTAAWTTPGGVFAASASAGTVVNAIGDYTWSSPRLALDVQAWVDAPAANYGWALVGDESMIFTSKQYASRESLTPAFRPALTVTYFCGADFDRDGFTTGDDFDAYVAAFELGDISSDFDGDGFVTGDDFDAYVVAFELGC